MRSVTSSPIVIPKETPDSPYERRVRHYLISLFVEPPWRYPRPATRRNPWTLTEYRFNAAGHYRRLVGCFPSKDKAKRAASEFLCHAEAFAMNYHARYIGQDVIDHLTYNCYMMDRPLDVMGFAVKVDFVPCR